MPVYNAGNYLREAIESVLAQTFRDFELLLIDDAATDGSGAVCDDYAAKDSRVRVKHGRNGGICASRNAGLAMARGEWIAFCDHDDFMCPECLNRALTAVEGTGAKIVKFNHKTYWRYPDGHLALEFPGLQQPSSAWSVDELLTPSRYPFFRALEGLVWDGLYRRCFLEEQGLRFDESFKAGGEDFDFMTHLLSVVEGGLWIDQVLYRHYYNVGSSTSSGYHPELLEDYLRTAKEERRLFPAAFADPGLRFTSYAEWTVPVIHFVFYVPGCTLSGCDQARWLRRYFNELVGTTSGLRLSGLPFKRKLLLTCVRFRLLRLYLLVKSRVVGLRKRKGACPDE